MIVVAEATPALATVVAANMREEDAREVVACGMTPRSAMAESLQHSLWSHCAIVDGVPAAVWGIVPWSLFSRNANVWMLGTPLVPKHRKALLRLSRAFIEEMQDHYPVLDCLVDARYDQAIRWVSWLGFKPKGPVFMGTAEFTAFERRV